MSRNAFCMTTADSQHKQARAESVAVYRINHLPPEQTPSHQRDFPRRDDAREAKGASNSGELLLLVLLYLLAMFVGILLLGALTRHR